MKKEALLKELVKLVVADDLRPNEFTMSEYITACRKTSPEATSEALRARLYSLVRDGKYKSRKIILNGKSCSAFYKA